MHGNGNFSWVQNFMFYGSRRSPNEYFLNFILSFPLLTIFTASIKKENSQALLIYIHSMSLDIFLVEGESKCHFLCDIKIISNTFMFIYFWIFFVFFFSVYVAEWDSVLCRCPLSLSGLFFFFARKNSLNEFISGGCSFLFWMNK